jgi:hypothetical protein
VLNNQAPHRGSEPPCQSEPAGAWLASYAAYLSGAAPKPAPLSMVDSEPTIEPPSSPPIADRATLEAQALLEYSIDRASSYAA